MSALSGVGSVKPDSQPPMLGCHAIAGAALPARPRPPPAAAASGATHFGDDGAPRLDCGAAAPRPRPPPRPPKPAAACGMMLPSGRQPLAVCSDTVDGPRIVPSSWRLL